MKPLDEDDLRLIVVLTLTLLIPAICLLTFAICYSVR